MDITKSLQIVFQSQIKPDSIRKFIIQYMLKEINDLIENDIIMVYPNFKVWLETKVKPDLLANTGSRDLILILENNTGKLAGFAIVKDTEEEKKICTFRVHEKYRRSGCGKWLMEECLCRLKTTSPVITVSSKYIGQFEKIFDKFKFVQTNMIENMYVNGMNEYIYNK